MQVLERNRSRTFRWKPKISHIVCGVAFFAVPFCDHVTDQEGIQVHNLTKKTRDQITQDLLSYIQHEWIRKQPRNN